MCRSHQRPAGVTEGAHHDDHPLNDCAFDNTRTTGAVFEIIGSVEYR